jgi:hypothetical protein
MAVTKEAVEVLKNARSLIEPRGKWIQGSFAKTREGVDVGSYHHSACRFCALGALRRSTKQIEYMQQDAQTFLSYAMASAFDNIPSANDHSSTKQLHVLMAYDFAILMAEDELKDEK